MKSLTVLHKTENITTPTKADGLFVEIGLVPNSKLVKGLVNLNEKEEIIVDSNQMTSLLAYMQQVMSRVNHSNK